MIKYQTSHLAQYHSNSWLLDLDAFALLFLLDFKSIQTCSPAFMKPPGPEKYTHVDSVSFNSDRIAVTKSSRERPAEAAVYAGIQDMNRIAWNKMEANRTYAMSLRARSSVLGSRPEYLASTPSQETGMITRPVIRSLK